MRIAGMGWGGFTCFLQNRTWLLTVSVASFVGMRSGRKELYNGLVLQLGMGLCSLYGSVKQEGLSI